MQKLTKNTLEHKLSNLKLFLKYNWPSILWAAFILVASLLPTRNLPEVRVSDKLVHGSIYTILFLLTYFGWKYQPNILFLRQKATTVLMLAVPLFGFIIEVLQGTCTTTRYFDWWDTLANTVGALMGLVLIHLLKTFHFFEKL